MTAPEDANPDEPRVSAGIQLMRDLTSGKCGFGDVDRFYAAAAEMAQRSPRTAAELQGMADELAARKARRSR